MLFRRFEHLIDVFKASPDVEPPAGMLAFYAYYLRQVWPLMLAVLVVGFVAALIEVALFSFLGQLIDMTQNTPSGEFFEQHQGTLLWMLLVALVIRPLVFGLHNLLTHQTINPGLTNLIRWQNHRYVLKQSLSFFQNDFAGRIAQRIMQTGPSLRDSAMQVVDALWHVLVYAASALYLFAAADLRLIAPLLLWIVGYCAALWYFVPRIKERSAAASAARSKVMGRVVDGYSNITTLKLFAHTQVEEHYAREAMQELLGKVRLQSRIITTLDFLITCLNGMLIVGTGALALWLWDQQLISTGAIALALGLVIRINGMAEWIMWVVNGIFENVGTVQDGMKTIVQPRQVLDQAQAKPLHVSQGAVQFDNIHFHYGKRNGVIAGLSLTVAPGEKIGLIGPSGAGKSTLANLLLRLYDLESGRILIDGQNIADVAQESLRAQIGMVTQDTSLLHRSIRDNLLYGKPDASDAELWEAVHKARADEFIPLLSDAEGRTGFDAHVGERGVKLSGGQRQRIAIARAMILRPLLVVLDEPTSALDMTVQVQIVQLLRELQRKWGLAYIFISHDLRVIRAMAHKVMVMQAGDVVEAGDCEAVFTNAQSDYTKALMAAAFGPGS